MKKKEKKKLRKQIENKKEEHQKAFMYKLNVNPRLLKFNLVAEKTKNQFFKLIFSELRVEPESLYQKLGIKKPDKIMNRSMTALRMHMGLNAHIYNPDFYNLSKFAKEEVFGTDQETDEALKSYKKVIENKEATLNQQRETNQIDNDLFLSYKNSFRKNVPAFVFISSKNKEKSILEGKEGG